MSQNLGDSYMRDHGYRLRSAVTTIEVVVAIVLLGSAVVLLGKFGGSVQYGLKQRELSTYLDWEIANAREVIGGWTPDQITAQRIRELPVSEMVSQQIQDAQWTAEIIPIEEPITALRVDLRLQGTLQGHAATPAELTFWVSRRTTDE